MTGIVWFVGLLVCIYCMHCTDVHVQNDSFTTRLFPQDTTKASTCEVCPFYEVLAEFSGRSTISHLFSLDLKFISLAIQSREQV